MKITDYQKVQTLDESNIVLIDGNNGTKTIMVTDFIKSFLMVQVKQKPPRRTARNMQRMPGWYIQAVGS